jgi:hypothetical protein
MKVKIEIKSWMTGAVLFEYEKEDNTVKDTVEEAVRRSADLSSADLSYADLRYANLRSADLSYADLRYANLRSADLSYANLRSADLSYANLRSADLSYANLRSADLSYADLRSADLSYANLSGIPLKNLPETYINLCSRDMLFIFQCLKGELPFLRDKLVKGEVEGTQYEGECACLVGTLGNADGGVEKVCSMIPFYDKGTHNPGEAWFLNIHKGDKPKNNEFAKHALKLIDMVLKEK